MKRPEGRTLFLVHIMTNIVISLACHRAEYQIGLECCPMCPAGTRVNKHCTEFRSTSCLPCDEGTYMDDPTGMTQCFRCQICASGAGLKVKTACSSTSNAVCEPQQGHFCEKLSDEGSCVTAQKHSRCEPGQFIQQPGLSLCVRPSLCCETTEYTAPDGQCCPMCHEGTVVIRHCTESSSTRCGPCAHGTYMNQLNGRQQCFLCSICHSAHGLLDQQPCSSVSDSLCGARSGFFCERFSEGGSCEAAKEHSTCSPGQKVKEPGTRTADTKCEECPAETFSPVGTNCTAWTRCSKTQVIVRKGSREADVLCGQARRNHYSLYSALLLLLLLAVILVLFAVRGQSNPTQGHEDQSVAL